MKRFFAIILVAAAMVLPAAAQKADKLMEIGAYVNYGTAYNQVGLGAKFQFNIVDKVRIEPSFDYMFRNDNYAMWDINLVGQYVVSVVDKFNAYPLLGVSYSQWSYETFNGKYGDPFKISNKFAPVFGAGCEYYLTDNLAMFVEGKYQVVSEFNQFMFSLGVKF